MTFLLLYLYISSAPEYKTHYPETEILNVKLFNLKPCFVSLHRNFSMNQQTDILTIAHKQPFLQEDLNVLLHV